jgi:hypothetical protein
LSYACFDRTTREILPLRPAYTAAYYKYRDFVQINEREPSEALAIPIGATFLFIPGDLVETVRGFIFRVDYRFIMGGLQFYRISRSFPDAPSCMVTDESDLSLHVFDTRREKRAPKRMIK